MYEKWFGAGLLFVSLLVAGLAGENVKVYYGREEWAKTEKDDTLVDVVNQTVLVPPLNSSTGWVGCNITLPNQGKAGYRAVGALAPADQDPNPEIVMNVVNESGLYDLTSFEPFDPSWWDVVKVYASCFLNSTYRYILFEFYDLDNCSKYILLFRGQKEEAQDRPILISIRESWLEPRSLLELTPLNASIIAATAFTGLGLIAYDLNSRRNRNRPKHRLPIRNVKKTKEDLQAKRKNGNA